MVAEWPEVQVGLGGLEGGRRELDVGQQLERRAELHLGEAAAAQLDVQPLAVVLVVLLPRLDQPRAAGARQLRQRHAQVGVQAARAKKR